MTLRSREVKEAADRLAEFISSPDGRLAMLANGYESGRVVVPSNEDELATVVMARIRMAGGAPLVLAVHRPSRGDGLQMLNVTPSTMTKNQISTGGDATIGMIADAVSHERRTTTVRVEADVSLSVFADA